MALTYPLIDPVLVRIGPLEVRWYGLMYLLGFALGYLIIKSELKRKQGPVPVTAADDFLFYLIVGLLVGGRVGYVLFYNLKEYVLAPTEIFKIWHGGMSFHGGLIGMFVSGYVFARKHNAQLLDLADIGALAAPLGLMLGRIGNFINGELFGRPTMLPWGVVFPMGGGVPRHPSQLYEALCEGPILFMILWFLRTRTKRPGEILVAFLCGYGIFRFFLEFFREPDPQLGFIIWRLSMGQLLCLAMIVAAILLLIYIRGESIESTKPNNNDSGASVSSRKPRKG